MYSLITSLGGTDYKDIFVHFSKTTERIFKILFANPPVMLGNTGRHTGDITLWILSTVAFFVNTCYVVAHCAPLPPPIPILFCMVVGTFLGQQIDAGTVLASKKLDTGTVAIFF